VRNSPVIASDETSARVKGKTHWQWTFVAATAVVHLIAPSRGKIVPKQFLDGARPKVWISDRLPAQCNHADAHQFCLAHLIRDAQYAIDAGDTVFAPAFKEFLKRACDIGRRRPNLADVTIKAYARTLERERDRLLELQPTNAEGRHLRDAIIVDARDKLLVELLKRMREMLIRFLGTVQAAHVAFLDEGAFERWNKPIQRGTRRLAGIDLNKARNRHVVDEVVALSTRPGGFTLAQVAEAVQQRAGRSLKAYTSRNAAYDLVKLKGKKLVHRIEGSRRYKADPSGVRVMCAYLICATMSSNRYLPASCVPLVKHPSSKPRSISTTSGSARSSIEPLKLSGWQRLEKLAGESDNML
jgi:hypothetical protein